MQPVVRWGLAALLLALAGESDAQPVCVQGVLGWTRDRLVLFDRDLAAAPIALPGDLWGRPRGPAVEGVSGTASPRTGALFVSTSAGMFVLERKGANCP
jgi:hypothetical protein